jgi:hypothetical protein
MQSGSVGGSNVGRRAQQKALRKKHPAELKRGELLELVTCALELEGRGDAEVVYDAHIAERSSGRTRQFDIAIQGRLGGRSFSRVVEVQDRLRKVGLPFVDQVEGKCAAVGVHRATIVAAAGFSKGALARIASARGRLDAFEFRTSRHLPSYWGVKSRPELPIEHRTYNDALTGELIYDVFYGSSEHGVHCWLVSPLIDENRRVKAWCIGDPNAPDLGMTMSYVLPSGERQSQTDRGTTAMVPRGVVVEINP